MLSGSFRSRDSARRFLLPGALLALAVLLLSVYTASAVQPGNAIFQRTWDRTDLPVRDGIAARTWMWGPEANTALMTEPYTEAPGGSRSVQYFDKARMEDNSYRADGPPWDVTNGLLVVELITGEMQVGDNAFETRHPADVHVVGDEYWLQGFPLTYADISEFLNQAPYAEGEVIDTFYRGGFVGRTGYIWSLGEASPDELDFYDAILDFEIQTAHYVAETNHTIAEPFWTFMNSTGTIYQDGQLVEGGLFENPYFATGFPITEPNWVWTTVGGEARWVLVQCFERRCLTYTPGNPAGFVVEAGNVGQHYYQWRYVDNNQPSPTEEPTATATGEPTATTTAEPTATSSPSPTATATATVEPTPTAQPSPTPALDYAFAAEFGGPAPDGTEFDQPTGVAVSPTGFVYIAEDGEDRIQGYTTSGFYQIQWGESGAGDGQFGRPAGVATDADGNVFVVDQTNHRVQVFNASGEQIRHWGAFGSGNGAFWSPIGIAISSSGQVYVVDSANHRVQRFNIYGDYLGQFGGYGTDDGQFNSPAFIAINQATGNVYVSDTLNHRVQKFDSNGNYLLQWGTPGAGDLQFDTPQGIAVDSDGNVYVADYFNNRIKKFDGNGNFTGHFGSPTGQPASFLGPFGLAIDAADTIYVVDADAMQLRKFDSSGNFLDVWWDGGRGRFYGQPAGLELDSSGNLYIAESYRVVKLDAQGQWVMDITHPTNALNEARAVVISPNGDIYVADQDLHKVIKFDEDGDFIAEWGAFGSGNGQFVDPYGLALDADGNVYVVDSGNNRIQKFTGDGATFITQWGKSGNGNGEFNSPHDIAIHGERAYVADEVNHRIQIFDLDGNYLGQWGSFGSADGQLKNPFGVDVDMHGYVYVADTVNDRIQKFTPEGLYLATIGSTGSAEGQLKLPYRVQVDDEGNVFVADTGNFRIQKFVPAP